MCECRGRQDARSGPWLTEQESAIIQGDKLEAVRMELADIQIYLIRIADKLNVELLDAVEKKLKSMKRNTRKTKSKGNTKITPSMMNNGATSPITNK